MDVDVEFYSKQDQKQCMAEIPFGFSTFRSAGRVRRSPLLSAGTKATDQYPERYLRSRDPAQYSCGSSRPPTASRVHPKWIGIASIFIDQFGVISKGNPLEIGFSSQDVPLMKIKIKFLSEF